MKRVPLLALIVLTSCGSSDPAPTPAQRFSLHEWGLIAVASADSLDAVAMTGGVEVTSDPARTDMLNRLTPHGSALDDAVGLKPVVYVHVDGAGDVNLSVRVTAPAGKMLEVAPPPARGPDNEARWIGLRAGGASCPTPPVSRAACHAEDRYCEALEDPFYDTRTASCLHLRDGSTRNHLFYRARVDAAQLPFAVTWSDDGTVRVHNNGDVAVPGPAFRIRRGYRGLAITRFNPPAPGADVDIPQPTSGDAASTRAAIIAALLGRGLDDAEARAFDTAWAHILFGEPIPPAVSALDVGRAPPALAASEEVILYLLPDALVSRILPIDVDPPPTAIHRALYVRMAISPTTLPSLPEPDWRHGTGS